MRAKFMVVSVTQYVFNETATLQPVQGEAGEDHAFWEATPSGKIEMGITAQGARGWFKVGQKYYVDFTPAE